MNNKYLLWILGAAVAYILRPLFQCDTIIGIIDWLFVSLIAIIAIRFVSSFITEIIDHIFSAVSKKKES